MAEDSEKVAGWIESLRSSIEDIGEVLEQVYDHVDEAGDPDDICDLISEHRWTNLYDLLGLVDRIEEVVE